MQDGEVPSAGLRRLEDPARYVRFLRRVDEPPWDVARAGRERGDFPVLGSPASITRSARNAPDQRDVRDYLRHSCDLTMPAGNGLGLLYPTAACALAEHYVVRRVAGASTGAIAAAATAAAELGRTAPAAAAALPGFAGLARAVRDLAEGDRRLLQMLQAPAESRGRFRLAVAVLRAREGGPLRALGRIVVAAHTVPGRRGRLTVAGAWLGALLGWAGLTIALARAVDADVLPRWTAAIAIVLALGAALAMGVVAAAVATAHVLATARTGAGFGLVTGVAAAGVRSALLSRVADRLSGVPLRDGTPGWATWAADLFDDLAGIPPGGEERRALTFGDLWSGSLQERDAAAGALLRRAARDREARTVDLDVVATDLSQGRALHLPPPPADVAEQAGGTRLLFCETCLSAVVPRRVVVQMVKGSQSTDTDHSCPRHDGAALRELPEPEDLPVALAVRMSAAVPLVMAAVPLCSVVGDDVRLHWFTDGGITANAPVATFDTLLPRWPTFGIEIAGGSVPSPSSPQVAVPDQAARPGARPVETLRSSGDVVLALVRSALSWRDTADAAAPGTAGRIACVSRPTAVGVLPDGDAVLALAVAGMEAGTALRERFTGSDDDVPGQTRTDRYRWIRLRSALREYRGMSRDIAARMPLYRDLASSYHVPAALSDWFDPPLRAAERDPLWAEAVTAVTTLRALSAGGALDFDVERGAPPATH